MRFLNKPHVKRQFVIFGIYSETAAHRSAALKNAELSQTVAHTQQQLNDESVELAEANEATGKLQAQLAEREQASTQLSERIVELEATVAQQNERHSSAEGLQKEMAEKNKVQRDP